MTSIKSILFVLTVFIAYMFICAWKQTPPTDPIVEKLVGKWNWVETRGGRAGTPPYFPSTVKYTGTLEFERNGKFKRYKDEKLLVENNFILTIDSSVHSRPKTYWLKNVGNYSQSISFKGNDTLVLTDVCDDCFTSIYARIK